MTAPIRYGSWSADRGASFGGLGVGSWLGAAATGIPVLAALGAHRWALAAAWAPLWAALVVLVAVPVRGRTPMRWGWDSCHRFVGGVLGWTEWQSRAAAGDAVDLDEADLPGVLSGVWTFDGPPFGPLLTRPVVVADDRERTWAVVARLEHPGIGLAESGVRARLGQGLAELLEGAAAAELVSSIALQVRTVPDDGAERATWEAANLRSDSPVLARAAISELTELMTAAGVRHEVFVTVVVPERRAGRLAKEAGGGTEGRARVLYSLMTAIESRLLGPVGCSQVAWLDSPALAAAVRTGFAPGDRAALTSDESVLPMAAAGPTSAPPPERRHYVHDAWQSVTCTVLLPDKGAVMGALAPVLAPTAAGERRSVTVFFEPIGHTRADRMIGNESMNSELTNEIRRRGGFRVRASHRQEAARVHGRDARFAEGNALVRVAVAAAVTVPSSWAISDYGRRLESSITTSGFTALRLDLAQDSAFAAACIPLGIGLPRRRGHAMRPARRTGAGRDLARLMSDFDHQLPSTAPAPARQRDRDPFGAPVGRRGRSGTAAGWTAVPAPLAVYRMTTEQVGGVWPLIAGNGLSSSGALLGIDYLSGGAFAADPIGWTLRGVAGVTNPNMIVFGAPGRGKSGTVKMFALRQMAYGYRTLVLGDVKDEYAPLCSALGVEPHAVGHGLPARINPLDFGPLGNDWSRLSRPEAQRRAAMVFARWLLLIKGLVGSQHVPFGPTAETAVGQVLRQVTGYTSGADQLREITIPQLWHALREPGEDLVESCRYADRQHFLDDTRAVRDALGSLVTGHLAGLFDAPTTVRVDWRAPIQSLSLSRLDPLGDHAVGVALTCLNSWGRAMTQVAEPGDLRIVIRDECWKQMRLGTDAVKSLDGDLRLSRKDGCIQIVVAHKPSDMLTVGDADSQAVSIARDLLHLCATKVLLGQDEQIGDELSSLLGLNPMAERIVTDWAAAGRGRALWMVGRHVAKVQTVRTSVDLALTDTNEAISGVHVGETR